MREDMAKVVTERPRSDRSGARIRKRRKRRQNNRQDFESAPFRESTGRHRQYGYEAKEFDDHLAPLRRYLAAQVGRPWDKVFSEICEHLDIKGLAGYHVVKQHLPYEVETKAYIDDDGIIMGPSSSI